MSNSGQTSETAVGVRKPNVYRGSIGGFEEEGLVGTTGFEARPDFIFER